MAEEVLLDYYAELLRDIELETISNNPVYQTIKYRRFVSKSKGRRNGKQRIRRNWKEIHLVKYNDGFHQWHRSPFDFYATVILGQNADGEMLKEEIINLWGF